MWFKKKDDSVAITNMENYSSSESSYVSYYSNYDTDINLDKIYKNKLLNLNNDHENLFKLKNDFYQNYGDILYREANKKYNMIYDKYLYESFDKSLYNLCQEIVLNKCNEQQWCFKMFFYKKSHADREINDMYSSLYRIKIESNQIRLWLKCVKDIKYCNNKL